MDLLRALLVTTGSPMDAAPVSTTIAESERWRENRPTNGRRALDLQELWAYRELIAFFALRDIKVRYKQAVFGGAWALVQPLAGAAIFTVVFGRLADLPSDGIPYLVFAFAGFTLWTYFSSSLNTARASLVSNAPLITKVYFPRLAAPVAGVLPGFVDLAASLPLLALMMLWTGTAPTLAILAAPLMLLGAVVIALGFGMLFAALTVQYRTCSRSSAWWCSSGSRHAGGLLEQPRRGPVARRLLPQPDGRRDGRVAVVAARRAGTRVGGAHLRGRGAGLPRRRRPRLLPQRAPVRRPHLMGRNAIEVDAVSKRYLLGEDHAGTQNLRETISGAVRRRGRDRRARDEVWSLRDVTFDVPEGAALGVIGRNGAGKSTLLKVLTRITEPTSGVCRTRGRVGSLLEVGTGFHPELTGRENVYLNGAILGMGRRAIERTFDEIVDFAGVERFLDTPVKRYSSGMYLRLAFAVAAHLEADILLVDEVLAVATPSSSASASVAWRRSSARVAPSCSSATTSMRSCGCARPAPGSTRASWSRSVRRQRSWTRTSRRGSSADRQTFDVVEDQAASLLSVCCVKPCGRVHLGASAGTSRSPSRSPSVWPAACRT
jgi:ABC-type polysaccharide/polyol phosphate transport system ATPase subunit